MTETAALQLTKGHVAIIDAADLALVGGRKWSAMVTKSGHVYAVRNDRGKMVLLHRVLTGTPRGVLVDHKDRDTLNCRRANLRVATKGQNNANAPPRRPGRYKGTRKHRNRWHGVITVDGVEKYLGSFKTECEAALAYNAAAIENFGNFAFLNTIEELS